MSEFIEMRKIVYLKWCIARLHPYERRNSFRKISLWVFHKREDKWEIASFSTLPIKRKFDFFHFLENNTLRSTNYYLLKPERYLYTTP